MRELDISEIEKVHGGHPVAIFFGGAVVGGIFYDGVKAAAAWWTDTFLAKDGSGGSRYPDPNYTASGSGG